MATYYWVGGAGTWNNTSTTNWSLTSGGAGGAGFPTSADNVIINSSSGTGVINATSTAVCNNLTVSATQAITLGNPATTSNQVGIYGNLTFPSSGSFTCVVPELEFFATTTGKTIDTKNRSISSDMRFTGVGGGWSLSSGLILASDYLLRVNSGTFNANNNNVSVGRFSSIGTLTRTITMGSGTWTLTGSGTIWIINNTATLNTNTASIVINSTSLQILSFSPSVFTYPSLTLGGSTPANLYINGGGTFTTFAITNPTASTVRFEEALTTTINTFTANGSVGNPIGLRSRITGSLANVAITNSATRNYINVMDLALTSGSQTISNGYISTNSTGWTEGTNVSKFEVLSTPTSQLSPSTWTVPLSWNSSNNTIHLLSGGGGGDDIRGGGGAGYSSISNFSASAGASISYILGAGGLGLTTAGQGNLSTDGGSTLFNTTANTITYVATAKAAGTAGSVTINKPTGTIDGDLMIAFLNAAGASGSNTFATLSGWNLAASEVDGGGIRLNVQYKYASSEGASYTFTGASTTTTYGYIVTYRNALFDTAGIPNATLVQNPVAAAITVAANNSLLIDYITSESASITYTTPAGFTNLDSDSDATIPSSALFSKSVNAGSSGTVSNTASGGVSTSVLLSIAPNYTYTVGATGGKAGRNGGTGGSGVLGSVNYTGGTGGTCVSGAAADGASGGGGGAAGPAGNGGNGGNGFDSGSTETGGGGGGNGGGTAGGSGTLSLSGAGGNNANGIGGTAGVTGNISGISGALGGGGSGTSENNNGGNGGDGVDIIPSIIGGGGGSGGASGSTQGSIAPGLYGGGGAGGTANDTDTLAGGQGLIVLTWSGTTATSGNMMLLFM